MKFKTILEGQQAVIFNHMGNGRLIKGPARLFLFRERLQQLEHYTATYYEYLKITDIEGNVTHAEGPCEMFLNPLEVSSIVVLPATQINCDHVIVVNKLLNDQTVERRIVKGPGVFIPEANEWLHEFKWHGPDLCMVGTMLPDLNTFTQLHLVSSHYFYYNVIDVRMTDDTMICVKMLIFYEIKDILKMLDNAQDPVLNIITAMSADIIAFAGRRTLNNFIANAYSLNELTQFPQLLMWADRGGIIVSKIVYRGYEAGEKLQAIQNKMIELRTEMLLETEVQAHQLRLEDYKIQMEQDRFKIIQNTNLSAMEFSQRSEILTQTHQLQMKRLQHEAVLENRSMHTQTKQLLELEHNAHNLDHYTKLVELGLDLTKYLVRCQEPSASEEYRVVQHEKSDPDKLSPSGSQHTPLWHTLKDQLNIFKPLF